MKRQGKNPNEKPAGLVPVEKIELDEKPSKARIIIFVTLLAVGLIFIGYAIFASLSKNDGWVEVETVQASAESVAGEFIFFYELGASEKSANSEYKQLSALYTELCYNAYRIFHADYEFENVYNLCYLNRHIGEEVTVDPALYGALEKIEKSGSRFLYSGAFYREYKNIFSQTEDYFAEHYDPYKNSDVGSYFKELSKFTADSSHIELILLGDNKVKLFVSDEYIAFAKENGIENFLDLYAVRNAFAIDYVADALADSGYIYGSISSYDGFVRVLDTRNIRYSCNISALHDNTLYNAAKLNYTGKMSVVFLGTYPMTDQNETYYIYQTGDRRHPHIDVTDGLCKGSLDSLVSYSENKGCVDILLAMLPVFIADSLDSDKLSDMKANGIYSIYTKDTTVYHNEEAADISGLYSDVNVSYNKEILN